MHYGAKLSLMGRHLPRMTLEMARTRVKFSLPYISPKTCRKMWGQCWMQDLRRWHELLCPSCHMFLQQVGHKPIPAQSTCDHWLSVFAPLLKYCCSPPPPPPPPDMLASGRCPNPIPVCQLVEYGCDQV